MKRLTHIDVAKGLFMLIVVYYHMICIPQRACPELLNDSNRWIFDSPNLFRAFFMAGFFFVSGMTSKFARPLKEQIINDAKTLLLPSMVICSITAAFYPIAVDNGDIGILKMDLLYGGGAWFITAMFVARLFYKLLLYINNDKYRWCVIFIIWILSFVIDAFVPLKYEFWHFTKALELMPFLELGRQYNKIEKLSFPFESICIVVYVIVIGALLVLGIVTPYVTGTSNPSPKMVPVFIVASVTGSVAIYKLAKAINSNKVLEYVGRNTLVFYLTHMTFLWIACELLHKYVDLTGFSVLLTVVLLTVLFIGACLWSTAFSYLLNTKYLKWILGKF